MDWDDLVIFTVHNERRHVDFLESSVKSVSENALVLSYASFAPACMLHSQN